MSKYLICYEGGEGKLIAKKSEFLANVFSVHSEEDVASSLEKIRKQYWDANHHCYAYIIGNDGPGGDIKKFSDDGEPSQTAGKPMMDVLENECIHDCLVVVTRYFGGTLLGTGGLVRAYQGAAKDGLAHSVICERIEGKILSYTLDYDFYGRIQRMAESGALYIKSTDFSDKVNIRIVVDKSQSKNIIDKVEEMSAAKAILNDTEDVHYILINDKVEII